MAITAICSNNQTKKTGAKPVFFIGMTNSPPG